MNNKGNGKIIFYFFIALGIFLVGKGIGDLSENNVTSIKMISGVMQVGGGLVSIGASIWGLIKSPKK